MNTVEVISELFPKTRAGQLPAVTKVHRGTESQFYQMIVLRNQRAILYLQNQKKKRSTGIHIAGRSNRQAESTTVAGEKT